MKSVPSSFAELLCGQLEHHHKQRSSPRVVFPDLIRKSCQVGGMHGVHSPSWGQRVR